MCLYTFAKAPVWTNCCEVNVRVCNSDELHAEAFGGHEKTKLFFFISQSEVYCFITYNRNYININKYC